jgi:cytochrome c-type biogenesis protein CcmH/NrfF
MTNPRVTEAIDSAVSALPAGLQQFKPTVTNGIRSLVSTGVQRLLAAQPFRPLTQAALTTAHSQLVNGQPVRFTLGQAKARIPASAKDGLAGQVLDLLPNNVGITLVTPADAPRLYNAVSVLKSLWWWVGLIGLAALAGALGISRRRRGTLRAWSVTTSVLAFILLITLRVARGSVLVQVKAENRGAVGAVYDVLAGSLRSWTLWLLAIGLFVLVETLVWGRLGLVSQIREGREARALAASHPDAGAPDTGRTGEPAAVPAAVAESWPKRVAADTRAFVDGLEVQRRAAGLGVFVRDHFEPARWSGIVLGVFVLLIWPSPTLSVLIWIASVVALWIGALVWLRAQAPEEEAAAEELAAAGAGATSSLAPAGDAPVPTVPVARQPTNGVPTTPVRPAGQNSAERALDEALLGPEVLTSLSGRLELLERLGAAHDAGVLTDAEFEREKGRLLAV